MNDRRLRVIVSGHQGRMGTRVVEAVRASPDLELAAGTGRGDDLARAIHDTAADVVVDFTTPAAVVENTLCILESGARPVIGTTGWTPQALEDVQRRSRGLRRGGIVAPNFSLGAAVLLVLARQAVRHFPAVEIVEGHHPEKRDRPSGTALAAAQALAAARDVPGEPGPPEPGCRHGIPIHSLRLPGLVAELEVFFGGSGETLALRHVTSDRSAFLPGVLLACRKVASLDSLVVGLEALLPGLATGPTRTGG